MDGASEVISKPPPPVILNGHIPHHLDIDTNSDNTTTTATVSEPEALTNPLGFNVDSQDPSDSLNRTPLGSEVSLGAGLPELPFPLPDIDGALIDSDYSLTPSQLGSGDGNSGTGFLFNSSMFNDDLVNSAIWSIGGDGGALPSLGAEDLDPEGQSEFSLESSSDSGASLPMPPEENIGEAFPPKDCTGAAPKENNGQVMPPVVAITTAAPFNNVVCMEDGFEDDFSKANPNPFADSSGVVIDPFFDLARDRALSTITEGFEEEDEDARFSRSGSFNPSSLNSVLSTFADAHEFVRLNSDPNSQQCKVNSGWVNFESSGAVETTVPLSNWSTQEEDAPPTPTPMAPGGLEENIGSPVSDGTQVGVSPETVEGGLIKPVGDSWQSVSNEDDVISGKLPSSGAQNSDQIEAVANTSVTVSHVASPTGDKINPSDAKFTANLEVSQTPERVSSPDSDASGEYMKLADLHISPVTSVPSASVDQQESLKAHEARVVAATESPKSPSTITSEGHLSATSSGAVSESEGVHSTNVPKSDSHSSDAGRTGTGIAAVAGAAAATSVVVNASTQKSTDDPTTGGKNRDISPTVQASVQDQSLPTTESSILNTSQSQELLPENDQTSSSLDTGDRSRTYSNLDRGTREESNLDSSNLDAGSRVRKDQPSTPPLSQQQAASHPATNLPVLSPLSPEHGTELNQQYEFLRRTLSHSQRRYSQRRKQQGGNRRDPSPSGAPGGPGGRRYTSSAGGSSGSSGGGRDVETRRKQTVGQLRELLKNSENATTTNHNHEGWCVQCTYLSISPSSSSSPSHSLSPSLPLFLPLSPCLSLSLSLSVCVCGCVCECAVDRVGVCILWE